MVLSRYGIEYVNDIGGERKPTCHRIQDHSIFDDPDYKAALQNADIYESYVDGNKLSVLLFSVFSFIKFYFTSFLTASLIPAALFFVDTV